jgi:hypothetical protein
MKLHPDTQVKKILMAFKEFFRMQHSNFSSAIQQIMYNVINNLQATGPYMNDKVKSFASTG